MSRLWSTKPGASRATTASAISSWYVLSVFGMYPQVPSRAELVLASPLFPRVHIDRPRGGDIDIRAEGAAMRSRTCSR
jgi:putative alpha-1,2-mannosidase